MPAILKAQSQRVKKQVGLVRSHHGRTVVERHDLRTLLLGHILRATTEENGQGQSGFQCLEAAARVIEIQYPELRLAKDLRSLVDQVQVLAR